ncbi:HWE histidine kinase domain-containing protein [Mesorhizobium sp. WSM2239]|uniref:Blue-light-activated histidine kinase n=2 Tax=unclassified Mesorhizobium TaxID=325217 RepID=A0AAU8DD89_9HYPH
MTGTGSSDIDSERRLAIATRAAALGIWDWNLITNEMIYSDRAKEICGFPLDEPVNVEMVRSITHPDDLPQASAQARRAIDPQIRSRDIYRYRIRHFATGEVRWVVAHGEAIFEEVDRVEKAVRYVGTLQDVTEQAKAEEAALESEARLRLAMEAADIAVWEVDLANDTITHSPELNRLCGFPEDARPTIEEFRSRYAPGERERLKKEGAEALARGETRLQSEFRQLWPDGTQKWMLLRAQFVPGGQGAGQRVIGVLLDITERKRAEERLKIIARELQHRVKNSLAIIQTIANQSFRGKTDMEEAFGSFSARLRALAAANDAITLGDFSSAQLVDVVNKATTPYRDPKGDPFVFSGEDTAVSSKKAVAITMALHELSTNAAKYGALSRPSGRVSISWSVSPDGALSLQWREIGGPPVKQPRKKGFGTRLLERGLFARGEGSVTLLFDECGLKCEISIGKPQEAV